MSAKQNCSERIKPKVLFLFGYGSEIRQFIYSGFIDELKGRYQIIVAARVLSDNIKQLSERHGFELVELIHAEPNRLQKFIFGKADAIFSRAFHRKKKFSYFGVSNKTAASVKFPGIYQCLLLWINALERSAFYLFRDKEIDRFLTDLNPSLLIVNLPRSPYFLRLLFQSKRRRTKNIMVFNTLKEIDANGRINIPIDHYFTWNAESSAELLFYNSNIKRQDVHAVGSPYYDGHRSIAAVADQTLLLYCAANPKAIPNEAAFVERLFNGLKDAGLLDNLIFVIRPNPMDNDFSRWHALGRKVGLRVAAPKWLWYPDKNWNEALKEDVEEYLGLLKQAKFVVGSASTVAVDSVVAGTPFICISDNFWPEEVSQCDFSYFHSAENFRLPRQSRSVYCLSTFSEMVRTIREDIVITTQQTDMPAVILDNRLAAGQKIVKILTED